MPPPICMVRRWARIWPRNTRLETSERYSSFCMNSEPNNAMRGPRRGEPLRSLRLGLFEKDSRFQEAVLRIQQGELGGAPLLEHLLERLLVPRLVGDQLLERRDVFRLARA